MIKSLIRRLVLTNIFIQPIVILDVLGFCIIYVFYTTPPQTRMTFFTPTGPIFTRFLPEVLAFWLLARARTNYDCTVIIYMNLKFITMTKLQRLRKKAKCQQTWQSKNQIVFCSASIKRRSRLITTN